MWIQSQRQKYQNPFPIVKTEYLKGNAIISNIFAPFAGEGRDQGAF